MKLKTRNLFRYYHLNLSTVMFDKRALFQVKIKMVMTSLVSTISKNLAETFHHAKKSILSMHIPRGIPARTIPLNFAILLLTYSNFSYSTCWKNFPGGYDNVLRKVNTGFYDR